MTSMFVCFDIFKAHDTSCRAMQWSHNDSWMVTADHSGYIKYWQSNMNNVKMYQGHKEPIRGIRLVIRDPSRSCNVYFLFFDSCVCAVWQYCYLCGLLCAHIILAVIKYILIGLKILLSAFIYMSRLSISFSMIFSPHFAQYSILYCMNKLCPSWVKHCNVWLAEEMSDWDITWPIVKKKYITYHMTHHMEYHMSDRSQDILHTRLH